MKGTTRTVLELVRAPNLFTAAADVLAGFVYAGGDLQAWSSWLPLTLSSVCLYAGGVVLNDVCDAQVDTRERPERPIPSGRVSRRAATGLVGGLLGTGFFLSSLISQRSMQLALGLIASIVLYNTLLKRTPLAPLAMGTCRAINLALGMLPAENLFKIELLIPVGLMGLYVASLTFFARDEAGVSVRARLHGSTVGIVAAVVGLAMVAVLDPMADRSALWLVLPLAVLLGTAGRRASFDPSPRTVQQAVKTFILCLILFDASLAWIGAGAFDALPIALLLIPTFALGRFVRMT